MREESKRSVDLSLQSLVSSVRWSTLDRTTPIQVRTMTNRAHMLMQDEWTSGVWSEVGSGFRLSETQLRFFLSSHAQSMQIASIQIEGIFIRRAIADFHEAAT